MHRLTLAVQCRGLIARTEQTSIEDNPKDSSFESTASFSRWQTRASLVFGLASHARALSWFAVRILRVSLTEPENSTAVRSDTRFVPDLEPMQ
jgi:hypothetical protein